MRFYSAKASPEFEVSTKVVIQELGVVMTSNC